MRKFYTSTILLLLFGLLSNLSASGQIVANDDIFNDLEGIMGDNSTICFCLPTKVLDNDMLNGNTISFNLMNAVNLTQVSTTNPNVNLLTTAGGDVIVGAGTPAGTYFITYQICEVANPSNCDTAVITVNVCNLAAPTIATVTKPTCTVSTASVLLTGLPGTGSWTIHDEDIFYATGSGTSKWITNLSQGTHNFTVTSGQCTSPPASVEVGYIHLELNGTYVDFNSDGIVNVGDKVNYQIVVKNISACALNNVTISSSGMTVTGGPLSYLPMNVTDSNHFSGSYTITQSDINTGYVSKGITAHATTGTVNITRQVATLVNLNIQNGIKLNAFYDNNANGVQDLSEPNFTQGSFQYQINSGTTHHVSSSTGTVNLYETNPANFYTLGYTFNSSTSCTYSNASTFTNVTVALNSGIVTYNFPIISTPCTDLTVHLTNPLAPPRPGFIHKNTITYKNNGSQNIASGTITFAKDPAVTITGISQTGTTTTANGFTCNFVNLAPNETRIIQVYMQVPTIPTVSLGDLVTNSVSVTPTDGFPLNNSSSLTQTIVGSWDPNIKSESHGPFIELMSFTSNDYLTYTIQFENTGTANAINVRVEDVLDTQLDETSIRMVAASHNYVLDRIGSNLIWRFDGINLPPSVPNSTTGHGYVTFQVKPEAGFNVGDVIPNNANIYFDFNPAIVTNTATTTFVPTLAMSNFAFDSFNYYPNPVKNHLTIFNASTIDKVEITSILGQTIISKKVNDLQTEIDLSALSNGIYFVKVTSSGQEKTVKVIKE